MKKRSIFISGALSLCLLFGGLSAVCSAEEISYGDDVVSVETGASDEGSTDAGGSEMNNPGTEDSDTGSDDADAPGISDSDISTPDIEDSCPSEKYSDLDKDSWYHESVDYVLNKGYFQGVH